MRRRLDVGTERWPLRTAFTDGSGTVTHVEVVLVTLRDGEAEGRGEAAGVYYLDETVASMARQIESARNWIEGGIGREDLCHALPAGGARNAIDCAMWELEAHLQNRSLWDLADVPEPRPLFTTHTLSADEPRHMADAARAFHEARALKLKLTGTAIDAERVLAVREARPDVWMGVDANQAFTPTHLDRLLPVLMSTAVRLLEQPFPVGQEADLDSLRIPIALAADESVQTLADIDALAGRFQVVNIKLDKCGGLTEALAMARRARALGLKVMVGNMLGTSLAMAPAFIVGQLCEIVDLDGPLFLAKDRSPAATYRGGAIWCAEEVWGHRPR